MTTFTERMASRRVGIADVVQLMGAIAAVVLLIVRLVTGA